MSYGRVDCSIMCKELDRRMSDSTARATPTDVLGVTTIELAAITLQLHQSFVIHKA